MGYNIFHELITTYYFSQTKITNLGWKNCKTKEAPSCAFILTHFDYCNHAGKALLKSQEHQATRKGK